MIKNGFLNFFYLFLFFKVTSFVASDKATEIVQNIKIEQNSVKKSNKRKVSIHKLQENFTNSMIELVLIIEEKLSKISKEPKGDNSVILKIFNWVTSHIKVIQNDPSLYGREELEKYSKEAEEYSIYLRKI